MPASLRATCDDWLVCGADWLACGRFAFSRVGSCCWACAPSATAIAVARTAILGCFRKSTETVMTHLLVLEWGRRPPGPLDAANRCKTYATDGGHRVAQSLQKRVLQVGQ